MTDAATATTGTTADAGTDGTATTGSATGNDAAAQTSGDSTQTADTGASTGASTGADAGAGTDAGETALGDAGKQALDRMKADRNKSRDRANDLQAQLNTALENLAKLQGKEAEFTAAQEAQRIKDEALAGANQRILKAEFRAAAAGKLNDPADALAYIDLSSFEVSDDGAVDSDAIAAAITDLITTKPYLAAQGGRFQGGADAGTRKETGSGQLTEADVKRLSAEGNHAAIVKAKEEGRLRDYLGS